MKPPSNEKGNRPGGAAAGGRRLLDRRRVQGAEELECAHRHRRRNAGRGRGRVLRRRAGRRRLSLPPEQVIAVDLVGGFGLRRRSGGGFASAVCEVSSGESKLLPGMLRSEVEAWLLGLASDQARVVVGLDFSFSLPAWFLSEQGCSSAPELWEQAESEGERWLREPHPHFLGPRQRFAPSPSAPRARRPWLSSVRAGAVSWAAAALLFVPDRRRRRGRHRYAARHACPQKTA